MVVKNVEKKEHSTVMFQVELDAAEFEKAVNNAYLKNKKSISVPGFRKGKAPRMVIEGMFGADVFYDDAVNGIIPVAFRQAVQQENLRPVGKPNVPDIKIGDDKSLTLTFETALYPEVTLGEYKGLKAIKPDVVVAEIEIDKEIDEVRRRNSRRVVVDRAAKDGDMVNIDYVGTIDGVPFDGGTAEGQNLILGSGRFVPGFESQLIGAVAGEERDLDILFDDDYPSDVAGKMSKFHVKINEVKEEELPVPDDEFAKDVSQFDTMEEYRDSIAESLAEKKENSAKTAFEDALISKAVENMTADIPEAMIDEQIDATLQDYSQYMGSQGMKLEDYFKAIGIDVNTFRENSRPMAEKQVKGSVLLEAVAVAEGLTISDEEFEQEYEMIAENYKMDVDKVKKSISRDDMKPDMLRRKAAALIWEHGIAITADEAREEEEKAKAAEKEEEPEKSEEKKPKTTRKRSSKAKTAEEQPAEDAGNAEKKD